MLNGVSWMSLGGLFTATTVNSTWPFISESETITITSKRKTSAIWLAL